VSPVPDDRRSLVTCNLLYCVVLFPSANVCSFYPVVLLLNWNVRGLNALVRRSGMRDMVCAMKAFVACLQETKLQDIDESMVSEILGPKFRNNYSCLPADDTSGGILIAASDDHFQLFSSSRSKYSLSMRIQALQDASEWTLTNVYVPQ
jgi:exonuclease III